MKQQQQQQPSRPVLIEPDSDVEEPPRKRFKSAQSPPLSTPKTCLFEALKVLRNSSSCQSPDDQSPDEATPLLIEITRKIVTRLNQRLDTSRIYPTVFIAKIPPANDVVIEALPPVPTPSQILKVVLPLGRPLGVPPRLPRMTPGESIKRRKVVQQR